MTIEKPKVEDFFRSVPEEVTTLPIFEDENGTYYAYGHVDPIEMTLSIMCVAKYNGSDEVGMEICSEDIQYYYAKITGVDNTMPDWEDEVSFALCKPTEDGAFPVSIWNY